MVTPSRASASATTRSPPRKGMAPALLARASTFPPDVNGSFRSLTSGRGFSCAIDEDSIVQCWGSRGDRIQMAHMNISMSKVSPRLILCLRDHHRGRPHLQREQRIAPKRLAKFAFEVLNLALGVNHSCAIRQATGWLLTWAAWQRYLRSCWQHVDGVHRRREIVTYGFSRLIWLAISLASNRDASRSSPPLHRPMFSPDLRPLGTRARGNSGMDTNSCEPPPPRPVYLASLATSLPLPSPPPPPPPPPPTLQTPVTCRPGEGPQLRPKFTTIGASQRRTPMSAANGSPYTSPSGSRSSIFIRQASRVMRRQRSGPSSSMKERAELFTLAELAVATNNFSPENKIGAGSFGQVYKGELPDGREVAIKRSDTGTKAKKFQEKESAFQSELAFLSRLNHKHLVGLIGYCEEDEERLLVYEFMKNGALYDHLHAKKSSGAGAGVLDSWRMRIKVLLDASRGIEYLHNYAVPPIIHRDIKSSNILLDGNWTARVSDFGLSLMGPAAEGEHLSMKAAGTVGYMDPEYYGLQIA
ncbi:hypothetical protein J5N97_013714 [Dioscorea zingiberensis]|uniref:Protein kinase domain-containing protein n=1 Tax=Dioscorea zingiberensis TaxID=325984 RepID=A0A9D5HIV8_9LILI|nr:hypothetical protein J5N97_013714 [Dioscorea zingiberensis]